MCGICGILVKPFLSKNDVTLFQQLLMLSAFRGIDSTGVFSIQKSGIDWKPEELLALNYKTLLPSYYFLDNVNSDTPEFKAFFTDYWKKKLIVGHTRAATKGGVSVDNAQPFENDSLIGVHNGTIYREFKHNKEFETDSEALLHNISEYGVEEALNNVEALSSAYAIVYYDKRDQTLNFIRNGDRPLYFTYLGDRKETLVFASEERMIAFATKGMKADGWDKETSKIFTLQPYHLLSIPVLSDKSFSKEHVSYKKIKITKAKIKTMSPIHYPARGTYSGFPFDEDERFYDGFDGYESAYDTYKDSKGKGKQTILPPLKTESFKTGSWEGAWKHGFDKVLVSPHQFDRLLKEGCCICGEAEDSRETGIDKKISWYDKDHYICEQCTTSEIGKQSLH